MCTSNCRVERGREPRASGAAFLALMVMLSASALALMPLTASAQSADASSAQQVPVSQKVGTVKGIEGNTITLTTDGGGDVTVTVQDTSKVLRVAPGSKDLKSAVAMPLTDLKAGDRILVRGRVAADAKVFPASIVVAMKAEDVQAKQARELADWQTRGTGGMISAVDAAAGTITISTMTAAGAKKVTVNTTKATILRRYAPGSVKFDDAKASTFDAIQPGDQMRARGTKSADGTTFDADEIITGRFRNIAGLVTAVDAATNTITLTDLATKKPLVVNVTEQTQLKKLQPQMAQMIAFRLKAGAAGAAMGGGAATPNGTSGGTPSGAGAGNSAANSENGQGGNYAGGQRGPGGPGGGRGGDFQSIVSRLPQSAITDFQKGDAVMVVATSGADDNRVTAITLLGGVEPILAAAPPGASAASQAALLSPWNLGGGGAAEAGGGNQ
jgi:hypothetical protein